MCTFVYACLYVFLCVCVDTKFSSFLFPFCFARCFGCFGISVYFFRKKIYVKRSANAACVGSNVAVAVAVAVAAAVSVDGKIVTDAVAVSFNGVKKQKLPKST